MQRPKLTQRDRDTVIQALRAGVVPKRGLPHIQVGRVRETEEMLKDVARVSGGGSAIRFVIGEYGSGKTFFLNLVRLIALERGLVVMSADLAPDRRLYATGGQARSLFSELTSNTATRSSPDGGALTSVMERFATRAIGEAEERNTTAGQVIRATLGHLEELTGGYDFATVIGRYWQGYEQGNDALQADAVRWLRAEFATRTDARAALGVRTIIDDAGIYDHLKLFSLFVREAGYKGLLVVLDEMVNLYKLANSQARNRNYEQILRILNDVLQGGVSGFAVLMGGTPEFLMDGRRGLYSYEALQTRLAENTFARDGLVDLSGPILRLANLTPEDLFVLLTNIRRVFRNGDGEPLPDDALHAFMQHCSNRVGDAYFRTPRNTVTAFVNLLAVIEQNPEADWRALVGATDVAADPGDGAPGAGGAGQGTDADDDELAGFKL